MAEAGWAIRKLLQQPRRETLEKCQHDRKFKKEVKIDIKDLGKDKFEKENHYFG